MEEAVLEKEMHKYFMQLSDAEKNSVVEMIKTFLRSRPHDERISVEEYNKEIDEAEAEIERGEGVNHEDVVALSNGWLNGR